MTLVDVVDQLTPEEGALEASRMRRTARKLGLPPPAAPAASAADAAAVVEGDDEAEDGTDGAGSKLEEHPSLVGLTGEARRRARKKLKRKAGGGAIVAPSTHDIAVAANEVLGDVGVAANFTLEAHGSSSRATEGEETCASSLRLLNAAGAAFGALDHGVRTGPHKLQASSASAADVAVEASPTVLIVATTSLLRRTLPVPIAVAGDEAGAGLPSWKLELVRDEESRSAATAALNGSATSSAPPDAATTTAATSAKSRKTRQRARAAARKKAEAAGAAAPTGRVATAGAAGDADDGVDDSESATSAATTGVPAAAAPDAARQVISISLIPVPDDTGTTPHITASDALTAVHEALQLHMAPESSSGEPPRLWQLSVHPPSSLELALAVLEGTVPELAFLVLPHPGPVQGGAAPTLRNRLAEATLATAAPARPTQPATFALEAAVVGVQLSGAVAAALKSRAERLLDGLVRPLGGVTIGAATPLPRAPLVSTPLSGLSPFASAAAAAACSSAPHAIRLRPLHDRLVTWGGGACPPSADSSDAAGSGGRWGVVPSAVADVICSSVVTVATRRAAARATAGRAPPPPPLPVPTTRTRVERSVRQLSDAELAAAQARYDAEMRTWEEAVFRLDAVVVDLGNACWEDKHFSEDIQTRQYRAPEVILRAGYDASADIWSLGAMTFELLTGDLLFDPAQGDGYPRDEDHLAQMGELLGPPPRAVALRGERSRDYYTARGELRHIRELRFWGPASVLRDKYAFAPSEAAMVESFLLPTLMWRRERRATAAQCLAHPWLLQAAWDDTSGALRDSNGADFVDWATQPELAAAVLEELDAAGPIPVPESLGGGSGSSGGAGTSVEGVRPRGEARALQLHHAHAAQRHAAGKGSSGGEDGHADDGHHYGSRGAKDGHSEAVHDARAVESAHILAGYAGDDDGVSPYPLATVLEAIAARLPDLIAIADPEARLHALMAMDEALVQVEEMHGADCDPETESYLQETRNTVLMLQDETVDELERSGLWRKKYPSTTLEPDADEESLRFDAARLTARLTVVRDAVAAAAADAQAEQHGGDEPQQQAHRHLRRELEKEAEAIEAALEQIQAQLESGHARRSRGHADGEGGEHGGSDAVPLDDDGVDPVHGTGAGAARAGYRGGARRSNGDVRTPVDSAVAEAELADVDNVVNESHDDEDYPKQGLVGFLSQLLGRSGGGSADQVAGSSSRDASGSSGGALWNRLSRLLAPDSARGTDDDDGDDDDGDDSNDSDDDVDDENDDDVDGDGDATAAHDHERDSDYSVGEDGRVAAAATDLLRELLGSPAAALRGSGTRMGRDLDATADDITEQDGDRDAERPTGFGALLGRLGVGGRKVDPA